MEHRLSDLVLHLGLAPLADRRTVNDRRASRRGGRRDTDWTRGRLDPQRMLPERGVSGANGANGGSRRPN